MESPYIKMNRFDFRISKEFAELNYYYRDMTYHKKRMPRLLWWFPPLKSLHESYWMDRVYQAKIGEYAEERDTYQVPDPGKVKFKGKTYLLVSNYTNSAAVVFSAIFKSNKLGTIVGQETGGRETFTSDSISIQMPNSRLMASIPVAILALPGNNPDRGVLPDVEVEYTLADEMSHKDLDLERVKELIRKDLSGS
jgi:C-terminal processing protease CtpA/Prc